MIGAAVLGLLSRYAEEEPVAVVVDDLHALDLPSAEAILFAARRLAADPVVVLAHGSQPRGGPPGRGTPGDPRGLDRDAAAALRAAAAAVPSPRQLEPLLTLAEGNPLALLELRATTSTRWPPTLRPAGARARQGHRGVRPPA